MALPKINLILPLLSVGGGATVVLPESSNISDTDVSPSPSVVRRDLKKLIASNAPQNSHVITRANPYKIASIVLFSVGAGGFSAGTGLFIDNAKKNKEDPFSYQGKFGIGMVGASSALWLIGLGLIVGSSEK